MVRSATSLVFLLASLISGAPVGADAPSRPGQAPCSPSASRVLEPRTIAEEGRLSVSVEYRFDCQGAERPVHLVFLQNGEIGGDGVGVDVEINRNYATALGAFVDTIGKRTGSRGGYSVFGQGFVREVPFQPLSQWPDDVAAWLSPSVDTSGLLPAMHDAASQLRSNAAPDADRVVVIVLTSQQPIGSAEDQAAACRAIRDANARVALLSIEAMRGSGGLGDLTCIDWFLRSTDGRAADLPQVFDQLAEAATERPRVTSIEIADSLNDAFRYVEGSGEPREPDTRFGGELAWVFDDPPDEGTAAYRVRGATGWADVRLPLSRSAKATFVYSDGSVFEAALPNPPICIHARNDTSYCEGGAGASVAFLPTALSGYTAAGPARHATSRSVAPAWAGKER